MHRRPVADVVGEQALLHADLRRGEPDAERVVHRRRTSCRRAARGRRRAPRPRVRAACSTGSPNRRIANVGHDSRVPAASRGRSPAVAPAVAGLHERCASDPQRVDVDAQAAERARRGEVDGGERVGERVGRRRLHECARPPDGPSTCRPGRSPDVDVAQRRTRGGDRGLAPETSARPPKGGKPSARRRARSASSSRRRSHPSPRPRRTSWSGTRVCTRTTAAARAAADEAGGPDEQPERLLGGPYRGASSSWSKLEERDEPDRPWPPGATRWSTASVPTARRTRERRSVAASTATTSTRGTRARELRRAASRRRAARCGTSSRGSAGTPAGGLARARVGRPSRCSVCATAASQRAQRASSRHVAAREQPRAARAVETQTARPPRSSVRCSAAASASESRPTPGALVAQVDDVEAPASPGAPCAGLGVDRGERLGELQRLDRRHRARRWRAARRRVGPLRRDVARVPRGSALLLQRLVAVVEHHDRGEVGNRREHRAPPADDDARALAGRPPTRRCARLGRARRGTSTSSSSVVTERGTQTSGIVRARARHDRRALAGEQQWTRSPRARGGRPGDDPAMRRSGSDEREHGRCRVHRDLGRRAQGPVRRRSAATRRAGRLTRSRPSATRPTGTARRRRRAARPRPTAASARAAPASVSGSTSSATTQPAHAPAVEGDAHDRADLRRRGARSGGTR